MSTPHQPKPKYRKRRLFPRTLEEVVKHATQPMMDKQGKLYSTLLRDWTKIVGPERAAVTRPERLQFTAAEGATATLHLAVRPAVALELSYALEQLTDQCARYFGYRAVTRIILHPTHGAFDGALDTENTPQISTQKNSPATPSPPLPANIPSEMRDVLARIAGHIASTVVKKN